MYKLVSTGPTAAHQAKWGGYNDVPPGWRKISQKELVQRTHFRSYSPEFTEFRQMIVDPNKPMVDAHLQFYWDGTGVGIVSDYWKGTVTFYAFGCDHDYREMGQDECRKHGIQHFGRCWHVSECTKCGNINAVDSSD